MTMLLSRIATALSLLAALSAQAQVGQTTLTAQGRPLTLVYPTESTTRAVDAGPFRLDIAPDAPLAPGQHHLVVMSHGTGGAPVADHALAAALARAGFVVAQVEHEGDNFRDHRFAGPESFRRRPGEVLQAIDALAADPKWAAQLDLSRVGVHGMSAGGVTALSLAGGQWSSLALVRHCGAHLDEDLGFCQQGALSPEQQAERSRRFASAKGVPDSFLPAELRALHGGRTPTADQPDPRPDPRIASVTVAVPVGAVFTPESLARIRVPVGVVSAQNDRMLLPQFHSNHVLTHCSSCHRLSDLPGAGHMDLLRPWPESVARETAAAQVRGGETTPDLDPQLLTQAHDRIVAFHRQHLLTAP